MKAALSTDRQEERGKAPPTTPPPNLLLPHTHCPQAPRDPPTLLPTPTPLLIPLAQSSHAATGAGNPS